MKTRYVISWGILLVFLFIFGIGSAPSRWTFASEALGAEEVKRYDIPIGNAPRQGPAEAPVTIVEFLDFQ